MKENLYTIFRSLFIVALLCGSMGAWADDGDAPTFTKDLRSEYFCIVSDGIELSVESEDAEYQWYSCEDVNKTNPVEISEEINSSYYYTPESSGVAYFYCVATKGDISTTSTVAKVNVLDDDPTSWDDLLTKPDGEDYYEIANIHDWYAFLFGYDNYSFDGASFKLTANITVTSAPSNMISSDYEFISSDCNIQYTTSCSSNGHSALFFEDTDKDDANVSYTYTINDETEWEKFSGFSTFPSNVKFQLTDNIETSTTPSLLTDNFDSNGHTITFTGLTSLPADSKSSAEGYQVFNDETLQGSVHYNYNVGGDGITGDDFVTFASSCLGNNDSFKLTGDAFVNTAPTTSLSSITSTNFDNSKNNHVYICNSSSSPSTSTYNDYIDLPETPCQLFANEDLDESVSKYYYLLDSNDDLKTFVTTEFLQKENVTICIKCGSSDGDTKYDLSSASFTYPLEEKCTVYILNESNSAFKVKITLPTTDNPLEEGFVGKKLFTKETNNNSFTYSYTQVGGDVDALVNALLDSFYQGAVLDADKQGKDYDFDKIKDLAGHGTSSAPYLIATYDMIKVLVDYVNDNSTNDNNLTDGMCIKLISDINAQGGERLTGVNGEKLIDSPVDNVQFSVPFKGHFDGNKFSLGGFTQPLFSSLEGATIANLGIVDCYMTTSALAKSAASSTITNCYVSGVSNGLVATEGNTVSNYYAWNTNTKTITPSDFTSDIEDVSGTHYILSDNCYTLGTDKYSDCTLFVPTDNTIYRYVNSNDDFKKMLNLYNGIDNNINNQDMSSDTGVSVSLGCSFINWKNFNNLVYDCVDNPTKSNLCLLHNVSQANGCWMLENNKKYFGEEAGEEANVFYCFDDLYSWYLVDKKNYNFMGEANVYDLRIKNIYYSRGTGAYDGLNTVYLPFAWDYANDVVDKDGNSVGGAIAYVLADKTTTEDDGIEYFNKNGTVKDYTSASSFKFFTPENFYFVSCALPTILYVPQSGWAIKKKAESWFYYCRHDIKDYGDDGRPNLRNRYDGDTYYNAAISTNYWGNGRSFMDIYRLENDYETNADARYMLFTSGHALHCGTFELLEENTFGKGTLEITNQLNDGTGNYDKTYTLSVYKLNSAGTGFVSVLSTSTVQPFRTFVAIAPSTSGDSAKESFGFGIIDVDNGGNVDSIDGMPTENIELLTPEQSRVYSIDGRYVGQYGKKLAPGLYIMNGKKILIRNAN